MFRLRSGIIVILALLCSAVSFAQSVPDFAKMYMVEQILAAFEKNSGGRTIDKAIRERTRQSLLSQSKDELMKLAPDTEAFRKFSATIGGATGDFTYTALATPCRLYDSRAGSGHQGAGTGPLAAGTAVPIYISDSGVTSCGIPYPGAKAVVLNFVAASPTGVGNLRAWPFDSSLPPAPNASILNFTAGQNLANGVVVPMCNNATSTGGACTSDLFIEPFVHATDVVIDALGYFAAPAATALEMANQSIPFDAAPQTSFWVSAPACPAGYTLTGGGSMFTAMPDGLAGALQQFSGEYAGQWSCGGFNNAPTAGGIHWTGTCTAYCARIP